MQNVQEKSLDEIRKELKEFVVMDLALEGIKPEDIDDEEILFEGGLGLDSLDAVEIVVLVQRTYGLEIADEEQAREIFQSMDTLARWIHEHLSR